MNITISVNPNISAKEIFRFYEENDVCEKGYGEEVASRVLANSSIIVGAFEDDKLVGITRAMFDGLSAVIMEFCLAVELQGVELELDNGSMMEKDSKSVGKQMGEVLVSELQKWERISYLQLSVKS